MSTFLLKIIAVICMVLDHTALFFPDMPIIFHWIGRISAPIFIFCLVTGMEHTHSKKLYLIRLYLGGIGMSVFQYISLEELNFFRTLFSIALLISILDLRKTCPSSFRKYFSVYILYQICTCLICGFSVALCDVGNENFFEFVLPALFGNVFLLEGGFVFVIIGILFYFCRENKKLLSILYAAGVCLYAFLLTTVSIPYGLSKIRGIPLIGEALSVSLDYFCDVIMGIPGAVIGGNLISVHYEWMMIFALPLILSYNGKRGKSMKWFFYVFYPLHIILFWGIAAYLHFL